MQDRAEQLWLATVKMALEAKKKGVEVSAALAILRNAKAMLNEGRLDEESHGAAEAEAMIEEAQRELFLGAASLPGFEKKWQEVITRVQRGEKFGDYPLGVSSFYPDLPRDGRWVRLPLTEAITAAMAREVASRHGLGFRIHQENHFILTGDKAKIKKALEVLSKYYRGG